MKYLVNRIGYENYLAAFKDGGGLFEHYKATGRELPSPLTEAEWIAEQGSIEGPILSWQEISDEDVETIKLDDGFSIMDAEAYESQIDFQNALAERIASGGDDGGLTPADDALVSDNFQDGNGKAPFNLQVRNTTSEAVEWVAVVSDVPYFEIPDLVEGEYSHEVSKDDDAYTHTFSGKLAAYAKIDITGGVPSPAGTGLGLELFIKEGS